MSIRLKLKNSVVQDSTPDGDDLPEVGELAVNGNINSIGGFMRASDNSIVKIFGPGSVTTPTATTTVSGIAELATNSETTTGTATNRVVTPAGLNAVTVAERSTSNSTYLALAGGTLTGVLAATAGSNSAPAIHFGDTDSGIYGGTNIVSLTAGGTQGLSVNGTDVRIPTKLGINGATPSTPLDVIADASGYAMAIRGRSADDLAQVRFASNDYSTIFAELESDATYLATRIGGSERLRVDSSGRLLVGAPAARSNLFNTTGTHFPRLQVESANNNDGRAALALTYGIASALGPYITLSKHRSNVVGANGIVLENDEIGLLSFQGNDGAEFVECARITGNIDGTPGSNDMPGRLVFSTTADGAASPTERLRIDSTGKATFAGKVVIDGDGGSKYFAVGDNEDFKIYHDANGPTIFSDPSNQGVKFQAKNLNFTESTGNTTRFRINDDGHVDVIGNLDVGAGLDVTGNVGIGNSSPQGELHIGAANNTNHEAIIILNNGGATGQEAGIEWRYESGTTPRAKIHVNSSDQILRFSTADSAAMTIDSSQNVGIGTTSPTRRLHVAQDANDDIATFINADTTNGYGVNIKAGGSASGRYVLRLADGANTDVMRVLANGNVGIGTTSPATLLNINVDTEANLGSGSEGIRLTSGSSNAQFVRLGDSYNNGSVTGPGTLVYSSNKLSLRCDNSNPITFHTGSTVAERMRIDSDGRVKVNTANLLDAFQIDYGGGFNLVLDGAGTISQFRADGTNGGLTLETVITSGSFGSNGGFISLKPRGSDALFITGDGKVGVGTTSPALPLDVSGANDTTFDHLATLRLTGTDAYDSGNSGAGINFNGKFNSSGNITTLAQISGIKAGTGNGTYDGALTFGVRNTVEGVNIERMRIDSAGRVGIGTSSPTVTLDIESNTPVIKFTDANATGTPETEVSGAGGNLTLSADKDNEKSGTAIICQCDGSTVISVTHNAQAEFEVGSTAKFQRNTGGTNSNAVLFNSAGNLVGKIIFNNTDTFYQTGSSDRTLKKNFENWTETILTSFKNLNPQKFNFTQEEDSETKHKGFIAQDLADKFPEAYPKDPETDKYGFNPSGMVVYLMKAIQELEAKVAALEAA